MKRSSTILLQTVISIIGVGVLYLMLWEPHIEGRNVGRTFSQIYFHDPFLIYAYTASIAFFFALYQTFKLLGYIGKNQIFTLPAVHALRKIRYSATIIVLFVLGAEAYLGIVRPGDDIAGGVFMGLLVIALSGLVASVAGMFEKLLHNAVEMKSENELTV